MEVFLFSSFVSSIFTQATFSGPSAVSHPVCHLCPQISPLPTTVSPCCHCTCHTAAYNTQYSRTSLCLSLAFLSVSLSFFPFSAALCHSLFIISLIPLFVMMPPPSISHLFCLGFMDITHDMFPGLTIYGNANKHWLWWLWLWVLAAVLGVGEYLPCASEWTKGTMGECLRMGV